MTVYQIGDRVHIDGDLVEGAEWTVVQVFTAEPEQVVRLSRLSGTTRRPGTFKVYRVMPAHQLSLINPQEKTHD
ncbi:hypothetical protein [Changpingibacter yushuensis]|uniref:hypothetical protein n=1 Tax=Changpingibacter yushuensis TaxID=2758440 RepID=UPI00165EA99C|nr:hypothetical protein [Changpingibacter yushuensis]